MARAASFTDAEGANSQGTVSILNDWCSLSELLPATYLDDQNAISGADRYVHLDLNLLQRPGHVAPHRLQ